MAPQSSLNPAAPAYIPKKGAAWIPPTPTPGITTTYYCVPPPPPLPCWGVQLAQLAPCVPGLQGPFHGGVAPPHGTVATTAPAPPAPSSCWPRPRRHLKARTQGAAVGPGPAAAPTSWGVKKAARDAKEAAANNLPSPRSVLLAATSPPISPTTSLPASFPYQLVLPAPPATTAGFVSAAAPSPDKGCGGAVRPPPKRLPRRPRRARPATGVRVRRTVKPRRLFDATSERASLMIRNIPNDFTRTRVMNILDEHCFIENEKIAPGAVRSEYDFFYLPIDFRSLANKGYAFVNMTSPEAARRLFEHLDGHRWGNGSAKTCAVDYAERQGREAFVAHFSGSCFDCHTEEFLPLWFEPPRDGTRPADVAMHVVGRLARPRA